MSHELEVSFVSSSSCQGDSLGDQGLKVATERLIMGGHECVFIAQWVKFKEHGEIWDYFKTFALKDYYPQEGVLNNSQN